ncbi:MAG: SPOR domain-containing protein [Candidatus Azobacteroides sp.]|nr:SPOR domain-containing protein [Candidatus Azobacteroides sp.]
MKSKIYLLWGLALALLFSFDSCKPKESAYKAAYEAAKAKEVDDSQVEEVTPVTKPTYNSSNVTVQKEKVTVVDGTGIRQFSVVVGSFLNKTNAESLRERMTNQGFQSFLAQNERGMYRVIVATYSDKASAVSERERVKDKYYPEFQDAWILDNQ